MDRCDILYVGSWLAVVDEYKPNIKLPGCGEEWWYRAGYLQAVKDIHRELNNCHDIQRLASITSHLLSIVEEGIDA